MSANLVRCELCFRLCTLAPGEHGNCRARYNLDGELVSLVYGKPCSVHVDPIEKKPLYHFLPGSRIFSIATAGCNGHCLFCQNWEISQRNPEEVPTENLPPADVVKEAVAADCRSVAFTYTDPSVFFEYAYDSSVLAKKGGLRNVLVTAGFLNEKPQRELMKVTDAATIDLKGNEAFYEKIVLAKLKPVQNYIRIAAQEKIFIELVNLIVPTLNDKPAEIREVLSWVLGELGPDVPMHFLRFFPMYKLANLYPTPAETMIDAARMAEDMGMHYVYVGNLPTGEFENTKCPKCKDVMIERRGYRTPTVRLKDGRCPKCNETIPGVWR